MSDRILILVGTMSGTAEMVAEVVAEQIDEAGLEARIVRMEKATPALLTAHRAWLICSSTYGTGEVPDNAKALYAALSDERPDLTEQFYGVVALGDSIYPDTFCHGGKRFDELVAELGARRIGDRLELDSRSATHADDAAEAWAPGWIEALRTAIPDLT